MDRNEHIRKCKREAIAIVLERKPLKLAVDTFLARMAELPDFEITPEIYMSGKLELEKNSRAAIKTWIEGFA